MSSRLLLTVDVAVTRGAVVFPYSWRDESATEYARLRDAYLAAHVRSEGYSLSPASLREIPAGYRIVMPSPNGAALSARVRSSRNCREHDHPKRKWRPWCLPAFAAVSPKYCLGSDPE